jgi:iron complex outermembrane receptor protein
MIVDDHLDIMRKKRPACSSALLLLFFFLLSLGRLFRPAATAQVEIADAQTSSNPLKQLTLEQLGNVEVTTVSKEPEQVWKTAAAVYVITNEEIQDSGATTIPDALRLAPGVEVAQIDSHQWSVGIRGFGSNLTRDILVLIDGRTVYTTLLAGTYWEVQNVMLQDVDRIEVIRGPGGTIWGPNAVNGVINIITKKSKDTHGALVNAGGGNADQGFLNARYGGGNGTTFDYRVFVLGFDRGPQFHTDGQDFDAWRTVQGGFRTDWTKSDRDTFTLQGDIYDEGAGQSVVSTSYTQPYSQTINKTALLSGEDILGRWERVLSEGEDIQLQAYYSGTSREQANFDDYENTFDVDFLDRFRLPARQQISWGGGIRFSHEDNPAVASGLTFTPQKRTDNLLTGFFQDEIGLVENRLTLSLGTKLIHTNFTGLQWQPSVRLLWTPTKKQTLWAAFTHAVRTPSDAEENFSLSGFIGIGPGGLPFFARFNPNPHFRPEELNGYELGYRRLLARTFYLDIAAFFNHYGDLFSEDVTGAPFLENNPPPTHILLPAQFGNGLVGSTKGVEIAPEWHPVSFWRLLATYSFLQMDLRRGTNSLDIGTAPIVAGSSQRHQATLQSELDFAKHFSFDLTNRYVSALPALKVHPYITADARLAWQVSHQFQLSVVGQNLYQPYHFEYGGSDPGPSVGIRRSVFGQVTWKR